MTDVPFINFAYNATGGSTPRKDPDRWSDIFNVKDYGAVGDGVNNDTSAINAAVTAASNNGIIFFPKGAYKVTSAIVIPNGSSLIFRGEGSGSFVFGNFNGFIFDNLSSPYNPAGNPSAIEQLNISNGYAGNTFSVTSNGTWSASASPVTITLTGPVSGVAVGGALWTADGNISTNTIFVGMITGVSGSTITVSSAATGSGAHTNVNLKVFQCYSAGGTWLNNATTITMSSTPPAGISGQYYVYNYEYFLGDSKIDSSMGVATWSGTTLTFTPGTGSNGASIGSSDRLWFAPVAGAIRYSSVAGAIVSNCFITGYQGITSSEDKIVANDPTLGGCQGFHIKVDTCTFSNPTGCQGALGQVGVYIQNNSLVINATASGLWCAIRLSGASVGVIGGRFEVNYFGIILGGDTTATNNSASDVMLHDFSLESNLIGIYGKSAGNMNINAVGALCNAISPNPMYGMYLNSTGGVVQNCGMVGNFQTGNAIFIGDPGNNTGLLKFISTTGVNQNNSSLSWSIPTKAWWGSCDLCNNPPLEYLFSGLPAGVGGVSPAPREGDTYDISDCNAATFLAPAASGGTGATARRRVRYNATAAVWQVVG